MQAHAAAPFSRGDLVRLTRSEMLTAGGKNLAGAAKGQEFSVLSHDVQRNVTQVAFAQDDGTLTAVALPADALEAAPRDGWTDLLQGAEAFRDGRWEDVRRVLPRAAQDAQYKALATAVSARVLGALASAASAARSPAGRPAFSTALQTMRDTAAQLAQLGHLSLALPFDEGVDRLGVQVLGAGSPLPPSKLDRADLSKRVASSNLAVIRTRQSLGSRRLQEAARHIAAGLSAEPARPELKTLQGRVQKEIEEADSRFADAERMRHFEKGAIHALTAIEMGLKKCADHPKLLALKKEMSAAFEERTAPPVTPAFLTAAKAKSSAQVLEEGHRLYTTRCTECHDLELLDSRSIAGWQRAVASMAGRAKLTDAQQARILDYLTAAQSGMEGEK
jgi:cytochrome c5